MSTKACVMNAAIMTTERHPMYKSSLCEDRRPEVHWSLFSDDFQAPVHRSSQYEELLRKQLRKSGDTLYQEALYMRGCSDGSHKANPAKFLSRSLTYNATSRITARDSVSLPAQATGSLQTSRSLGHDTATLGSLTRDAPIAQTFPRSSTSQSARLCEPEKASSSMPHKTTSPCHSSVPQGNIALNAATSRNISDNGTPPSSLPQSNVQLTAAASRSELMLNSGQTAEPENCNCSVADDTVGVGKVEPTEKRDIYLDPKTAANPAGDCNANELSRLQDQLVTCESHMTLLRNELSCLQITNEVTSNNSSNNSAVDEVNEHKSAPSLSMLHEKLKRAEQEWNDLLLRRELLVTEIKRMPPDPEPIAEESKELWPLVPLSQESRQISSLEDCDLPEQLYSSVLQDAQQREGFEDNLICGITTYRPDNPKALQRKIEDLESQVQDLQEANNATYEELQKLQRENGLLLERLQAGCTSSCTVKIAPAQAVAHLQQQQTLSPTASGSDSHAAAETDNGHLHSRIEQLVIDLRAQQDKNAVLREENSRLREVIQLAQASSERQLRKSTFDESETLTWPVDCYGESVSERPVPNRVRGASVCEVHSELNNEFNSEVSSESAIMDSTNTGRRVARSLSDSSDATDILLLSFTSPSSAYKQQTVDISSETVSIRPNWKNSDLSPNVIPGRVICQHGLSHFKDMDEQRAHAGNCTNSDTRGHRQCQPFAPRSPADLCLGDIVKYTRSDSRIGRGIVRYVGWAHEKAEMCVGIATELSEHQCCPEIDIGRDYFSWPYRGTLISFSKVLIVWKQAGLSAKRLHDNTHTLTTQQMGKP